MPYKDKAKQKEAQHEFYMQTKERTYESNRKRRKELREWFADITKNDSCKLCGETTRVCIDYHHRNPEDKVANVSKLVGDMRSRKRILAELEKCDSLCANCHRKLEAGLI